MSRRSSCIPYPSLKFLWRHTPKGDDRLFSDIREHCTRGGEVRIQRYGSKPYSIVLNDTLWLARPLVGEPIGSFENIAAAVMTADRHMDAVADARAQREADFGGDDPGSAA